MTKNQPQRRQFLQKMLAIVPASTVTASMVLHPETAAANPARSYEPTFFNEAEWAFIQAAVAHLIPADENGPGAVEAGIPEFIDRQMETPYGHGKLWFMQGPFHPDAVPEMGYQLNLAPRDLYRHGIKACNDWCNKQHRKTFAELETAQQLQTLKDIESGKIAFDALPAKTFFEYLLTNTKEGYLSDPIYGGNKNMAGWKLVGFPGARADYIDWVDQYNTAYPLGPVSISGKRG